MVAGFVCLMVFNATFNNISVISWGSDLWRFNIIYLWGSCYSISRKPLVQVCFTTSNNVHSETGTEYPSGALEFTPGV
jgi:hypothetical protein